MKRARPQEDLFFILSNVITMLNTPPVFPVNDPTIIPKKWLALHEKAKRVSEERQFCLKWAVMRHHFEQKDVPFDVLFSVVGPFFIGLITVPSIHGMVVRLYEPVILAAMRADVNGHSFFYHDRRWTIRKDRHDNVELLQHCHPDSEGGHIMMCFEESTLLQPLNTLCDMSFPD